MRDIPIFTTENGVASLVLREIPYKAVAYITLQDSQSPDLLLGECVDFCKAVGAEKIYAKGHAILEKYPLYTTIYQMNRVREGMPETDACLFPVKEDTIEYWRSIYNDRMESVPNSATMTIADSKSLLAKGSGYFVHRNGELLGIGAIEKDTVEVIISVIKGAGRDVVLALCSAMCSESVRLEVSSTNLPAIRLYEKLGFMKTAELSKWYCIV